MPALEIAQDGEENKPPHGGIEQAQVPAKAVPVKRDPGYIIQETQDSLTSKNSFPKYNVFYLQFSGRAQSASP